MQLAANNTNFAANGAPMQPRESRMSLSAVTKGKIRKPLRILLAGTEGIGKSTFAANAPSPIFLAAEDGTSELDVSRLPEPRTWDDVLRGIELLTNEKHDYKSLGIDTLDWLEPLVFAHVCLNQEPAKPRKDIEAFGYGKGYTYAADEWRRFYAALDTLRAKTAMEIILLAHTHIKTFNNPEGENFDRYEMKLQKLSAPIPREWVDVALFAHFETLVDDSSGRGKGVAGGVRVMRTERRAAWDAKNRFGLPEKMPLDYAEFARAVNLSRDGAEKLLGQVREAMAFISEPNQALAEKSLAAVGNDTGKLAQLLNWITSKQGEKS